MLFSVCVYVSVYTLYIIHADFLDALNLCKLYRYSAAAAAGAAR